MIDISKIATRQRAKIIINSYNGWIAPKIKVLDVGCGNGEVSYQIEKYFKIRLTGCDIIDYNKNIINFRLMKQENVLPFKNKEFDLVMMNDVLHHVKQDDQSRLIKEALRVGKTVLIFETFPGFFVYIIDYLINKIHSFKMDIPLSFKTHKEWIKLFKNLKVRYQTKKIDRFFLYPFKNMVFRLV